MDLAGKKTQPMTAIMLQGILFIILFISLETGHSPIWLFYTAGFLLMTFKKVCPSSAAIGCCGR
ncbi:hypothetical protein CJP46_07675 [Paenibacillus sp. XY044]|nr:hypothetical protein CJP46_07675 [Paenibacillus sp. XY044]